MLCLLTVIRCSVVATKGVVGRGAKSADGAEKEEKKEKKEKKREFVALAGQRLTNFVSRVSNTETKAMGERVNVIIFMRINGVVMFRAEEETRLFRLRNGEVTRRTRVIESSSIFLRRKLY